MVCITPSITVPYWRKVRIEVGTSLFRRVFCPEWITIIVRPERNILCKWHLRHFGSTVVFHAEVPLTLLTALAMFATGCHSTWLRRQTTPVWNFPVHVRLAQ